MECGRPHAACPQPALCQAAANRPGWTPPDGIAGTAGRPMPLPGKRHRGLRQGPFRCAEGSQRGIGLEKVLGLYQGSFDCDQATTTIQLRAGRGGLPHYWGDPNFCKKNWHFELKMEETLVGYLTPPSGRMSWINPPRPPNLKKNIWLRVKSSVNYQKSLSSEQIYFWMVACPCIIQPRRCGRGRGKGGIGPHKATGDHLSATR